MTIKFMSKGEIAEYLGVTLSTVKGYDLPEPDAIVGRNQGWLRDTIDKWIYEVRRGEPYRKAK